MAKKPVKNFKRTAWYRGQSQLIRAYKAHLERRIAESRRPSN